MSNGNSFAHISIHVGTDWIVRTLKYDDHTPILDIDAGSTAISISIEGRDVAQAAVEFARALALEAQAFAADVERLHAEQTAASVTGLPEQAA
jgi:hypothetical protein